MQEQDVITHLFNLTLAVSGIRAQIMTPSRCGLGQSLRYYGGSDSLSCSRGARISCISDHNRTRCWALWLSQNIILHELSTMISGTY